MISMIMDRADLDKCLFDEWRKKKEDSFIYGYLRERRETSARDLADSIREGETPEPADEHRYIYLRAIDIAFNEGKIAGDEEKIKQFVKMLKDFRTAVGDKAGKKFKASDNIDIDNIDINSKDVDILLKSAHEDIEKLLSYYIRSDVSEYFRSQGFSIIKKEDPATGDRVETVEENPKQRKYIDPVSLYKAYSESTSAPEEKDGGSGKDPKVSNGDIFARLHDNEYFDKCLKLMQLYNRQKNTMIYMPLYVDERTGMGIYIVGTKHLEEDGLPGSCYPCIIAFKELQGILTDCDEMDEVNDWMGSDSDYTRLLLPGASSKRDLHCAIASEKKIILRYKKLSDAKAVFEKLLGWKEKPAYNGYRYYNDAPSDMDQQVSDCFKDYMYIQDTEDFTEEELQHITSIKAEEDNYIKKMQNQRKRGEQFGG